jgi:hypothetical protein
MKLKWTRTFKNAKGRLRRFDSFPKIVERTAPFENV